MTTAYEDGIGHKDALDLVFDSLDFELTPGERLELDDHLAACEACRDEADLIRSDDEWLEKGFDWSSLDDMLEGAGYQKVSDEDDEEDDGGGGASDRVSAVDATGVDSLPGGSVREAEEDELLLGQPEIDSPPSGGRDRDDSADQDPSPAGDDEEGESDDSDPASDEDPDEGDSDEEDEDSDDESDEADESDESDDDVGPGDADGGQSAPTVGDDEDDDDLRREAEESVEAMSDEEVARTVDSIARDEDLADLIDACIADMVDDAAAENGAPAGEATHRRAEQIVRRRDGMQKTDFGTVAVYRSASGLRQRRTQWDVEPKASPAAAAAIRNAILRSRLGRTGVERRQARGRLDSMSLHRIAEHDPRLFKRAITPSPGKFLVWVMVDVSGSMQGRPVADAAAVARALADATVGTPTVRLAVWAWSDPFLNDSALGTGAYGGAVAGVVKVWEKGASASTGDIFDLTRLRMGSTPDAPVLAWAWREILKHVKPDEHPVIFMCSDGWGHPRLPDVIADARKHGVQVKSVALGNYVHELDQEARFGRGNYVPWRGSIGETARPLATMVAKMAAGE